MTQPCDVESIAVLSAGIVSKGSGGKGREKWCSLPIFRHNADIPALLDRAPDAQFFHFRLQRGAFEPQNLRGTFL